MKKYIFSHIIYKGDILKKIFEIIGFLGLLCFSFFYTYEISYVIKENDDLLKQIKDVEVEYYVEAMDAKIFDDNIIPGISGKTIDINESYKNMKKLNTFNSNLLVYKKIKPNISIDRTYDKFIISGNESKKEVSLIFLVDDNINDVLNILNKYNVKANFFVTSSFFSNNNELITNLINNDHIVGNILNDSKSIKSDISYMNGIVSKINKQDKTYCYNDSRNYDYLMICESLFSYSIMPSFEAFENPTLSVKKYIKNGSIIAFKINNKTITELPLIINYINSKGFSIVNISKLIEE